MKVDDIAKILQIYMLQNIYSYNENMGQTSMMFEIMLQSILSGMDSQGANEESYAAGNSSFKNNAGSNTANEPKKNWDLKNISNNIESAVKYVSQKYGVEEELVKAVIKQESSFNPNSVSSAGALGLMQLMPKTARSLGVKNPFNVLDNIDGGTRYLKRLLDAFDGNKELALAAYNGGIGRMNRLGVDTVGEISKMPKETRNYVEKVIRNYQNYKRG